MAIYSLPTATMPTLVFLLLVNGAAGVGASQLGPFADAASCSKAQTALRAMSAPVDRASSTCVQVIMVIGSK